MTHFYRSIIACIMCMMFPFVSGAQLTANFQANTTTGCNPSVIQFTSTSTGNPTGYQWNFGNGNTSTLQNPSTTYTTTGSFTVTLTITNGTASNTKTVTNYITIYPAPVVDFTANDTAGCPPHTVQFTDQSTLNAPGTGTYIWDFGNGNIGNGQNASYTFPTPGYYNIGHIVISAAGCTTSVTKPAYIHVYTPPVADFSTPNPLLCGPGSTAQFINATTGTGPFSCQWEFGDGGTSSSVSPSHTYNAIGSYTVKLIVTDANGCKDTLIKPNYIIIAPTGASFTAPASACEDTWVTFVNTTPFTIYANWDLGDGTHDTSQTLSHQYIFPGTYQVSIAVNNGTCIVYDTQTIVIHPKPTISFNANTLTPCPSPVTIQFTNTTTNGGQYTWKFGDGGTSNLTNPVHTYQTNGFFDVTLIAGNSFGCSDSLLLIDYVKIYPSILGINVSPGDGCIPVTDSFSASLSSLSPVTGGTVPYPATIASYYWNFGDGFTSTSAAPVHVYPNAGTYQVMLAIVTTNGCTDTATITVHTGTPPVPAFTAIPTSVCVDQGVYFQNSSTNATAYEWYFGDGSGSSATNPTKSYADPDTFTVTLVAENNGCRDTLVKTDYIVVNDPKSEFITNFHCDTLTKVDFYNTSVNYTSCLWDFGDGTFSTTASPAHSYASISAYTVKLITYNSATGCTDTTETEVNLFDPEPDFTANDTAICPQTTIALTAAFPGSNFVSSYSWKVDNNFVPDTTAVYPYTFLIPGYHTVSLYIKDAHNCLDTVTKTNYIIVGHPSPSFSANNTQVCVPASVSFTSTTTFVPGTSGTNYQWVFGNGNQANSPSPTASTSYTAPGTYDVKLVVTDNIGCVDSTTEYMYIHAHAPLALFNANNTNACIGAPVTFFDQSQGGPFSYFWDFGDGLTSNAAVPQHAYMALGVYTITLIVTDSAGCKDTLVKPNYITVNVAPQAAFSLSDTFKICPPLFVQYTNASSGQIINNWDFGDGAASSALNPAHIYTAAGIYTVRLIAINSFGCRDTAYGTVKILGYDGVLTYTPLTGCAPLTVDFSANVSNVPGLVWDFSDGTTLATTATTVSHTYLNPGPVVPKLIMTDNAGCSASSNGLDTIKVDGVYSGYTYDPFPACDSGTLEFLDTSHGAYSTVISRRWVFHDGSTDTIINPSRNYPGLGSYPITLYTVTNTGCLDTLRDTLTFYQSPVIEAGLDTTICIGDSVKFFPSGGVTYTWAPGASLGCVNCTNPYASPTVPTMYTVTGTDIHGCHNVDSLLISLKTETISTVGPGGEFCDGDSMQLSASGALLYTWTPADGLDNNHVPNPIASPDTTTTYMVIAREGSCKPDTNYVTVIIHENPTVEAGPDQTIVAGETAQIDATGTLIQTYSWEPSESLSCGTCPDPAASPKKTTTYQVTVTSDFGCKTTDTVTIFVVCDDGQVFMPNSFTPNGDGQNDKFYPRGKGIRSINSFRIYDRWGQLLFERRNLQPNDINYAWDGSYKGTVLNPDVYIYIVDAICDTGEPISWKGDISLIR